MSTPSAQDSHVASQGTPAAGPTIGAPPFFPGPFPVTPAPDGRHVLQMVQQLGTRVQKLERSKGQISKDLSEMLREAQELNKRLDSEKAGGVRDTAAARSPSPPAAASPAEDRSDTARGLPDPGSIPPPPGLQHETSGALQRAKSSQMTAGPTSPPLPLPEALQIQETTANGNTAYMVTWRIDNVKSKFKDCIGRPLVSPQFEAGELAELRLMVFPNIGIDASSTMRDQKSKFEAVIAEGPLNGALKFKVVGGQKAGEGLLIDFTLFVGGAKSGLMRHNFAEHIIKGWDFNNNWLQEMEHGALIVGVEISKIRSGVDAGADAGGDASDEEPEFVSETK